MSNLGLYLVTVLTWGTTWLAINYQLGTVPVEVSIAYRYLLAAVTLFAWCWLRGWRLRFNFRQHMLLLALGAFLFCFNYLATYHAQLYISSALNAVVFSTMVWLNILHARLFFDTTISRRVLLGAGLGMAGIVSLFWPEIEHLRLENTVLTGAALCAMGAVLASWGNMISQQTQRLTLPVLPSTAWAMLYGALLSAAIAWRTGAEFSFDPSPLYVASLLYLAIFGSVIGFGAYLTLLGRIGAERAGYAVVMFPVVALVLSVLFEGLALSANLLFGVALVLLGNLVILSRDHSLSKLLGRRANKRAITGPQPQAAATD